MVQFVIAGGVKALGIGRRSQRRFPQARRARNRQARSRERTMSWSASPPAGALRSPSPPSNMPAGAARKTIAVTCNRDSPLEKAAHLAIVAEVGPEVISGSTRMKAGTAQKMVLEHAFHRRHDPARLRLWQSDGQRSPEERKTDGARIDDSAAGYRRGPRRRREGCCEPKQRPRSPGHVQARSAVPMLPAPANRAKAMFALAHRSPPRQPCRPAGPCPSD